MARAHLDYAGGGNTSDTRVAFDYSISGKTLTIGNIYVWREAFWSDGRRRVWNGADGSTNHNIQIWIENTNFSKTIWVNPSRMTNYTYVESDCYNEWCTRRDPYWPTCYNDAGSWTNVPAGDYIFHAKIYAGDLNGGMSVNGTEYRSASANLTSPPKGGSAYLSQYNWRQLQAYASGHNLYGASVTDGGWDVSADGGTTWAYTSGSPTATSSSKRTINIVPVLSVSNSLYHFTSDSTHSGRYVSNNEGNNSSTAQTVFTLNPLARKCRVYWTVDSEASYDKLTITYGNTTKVNAMSGEVRSGYFDITTISNGDTITAKYVKDGSTHKFSDRASITIVPIPGTRYQVRNYIVTAGGGVNSSWSSAVTITEFPVLNYITVTNNATGAFGTNGSAMSASFSVLSNNPTTYYPQYSENGTSWIRIGTTNTYSGTVGGLKNNTDYHFRGYAYNSRGGAYTLVTKKTTGGNAPKATVTPKNFTNVSGTLQADITYDTNATFGSGKFEFGETTSYGTTINITSSNSSANLTGLKPGTTYYYKFTITDKPATTVTNTFARTTTVTGTFRTKNDLIKQIYPNGDIIDRNGLVNIAKGVVTNYKDFTPGGYSYAINRTETQMLANFIPTTPNKYLRTKRPIGVRGGEEYNLVISDDSFISQNSWRVVASYIIIEMSAGKAINSISFSGNKTFITQSTTDHILIMFTFIGSNVISPEQFDAMTLGIDWLLGTEINKTLTTKYIDKNDVVKLSGKMRYIDISKIKDNNTSYQTYRGVDVYDVDGNLISLNKPVTVAEIETGVTVSNLGNITDNNMSTSVQVNSTQRCVLRVDLGREYDIGRVVLGLSTPDNYAIEGYCYGRREEGKELCYKFYDYKKDGTYLDTSDGANFDVEYQNTHYGLAIQRVTKVPTEDTSSRVELKVIDIKRTILIDIINNLESHRTDGLLSANMGRELNNRIGNLNNLLTNAKDDLVVAINELLETIGEDNENNKLDCLLDTPFMV